MVRKSRGPAVPQVPDAPKEGNTEVVDEPTDAELNVSENHVEDTNNDGKLGVGGAPDQPVSHFDSDAYDQKLHEVVGPEETPLDNDGFVGVSPEYQGASEVRAVGPNDSE